MITIQEVLANILKIDSNKAVSMKNICVFNNISFINFASSTLILLIKELLKDLKKRTNYRVKKLVFFLC